MDEFMSVCFPELKYCKEKTKKVQNASGSFKNEYNLIIYKAKMLT